MQNQPYLRGDARKQKFLDANHVLCSEHSVLFPGETMECCCRNTIEGEYYSFSYGEGYAKTFFAGPTCGKRILELGVILAPPLCDPFGLLPTQEHGTYNNQGALSPCTLLKENREMVHAITLLLFLWENKEGYLSKIRNELVEDPQKCVFDGQIKSLNKAIASTAMHRNLPGKTLRELVEKQGEVKGLRMRTIRFPVLEERIQKMGERSNL